MRHAEACDSRTKAVSTPSRGRESTPYVRLASASLVARVLTLPVTGGANLLMARLVVSDAGVQGYALFALVVTLPQVLPLGDLGVGAAVMEACSRRDTVGDEFVRKTMTTSARNLSLFGFVIATTSVTFGALGLWPALLGVREDSGAGTAAAWAFAAFGMGLPLSLGSRALAAFNLNHLALLLQAVGSVTALSVVALAAQHHASLAVYCTAGFFGSGLAGVVSLVVAGRVLRLPLLRDALLSVWPSRGSTHIWQLAGPMAVVVFSSSLAYSSDRLILSHVAGPVALAAYSAGAQLYGPLFGAVSMMGTALWGEFARRRGSATATTPRDLARITAFFTAAGLVMALGLVTLGPPLATWLTHGQVSVTHGLMLAFAALLLAHACNYPTAMLLTDPPGLRRQAVCCCSAAVMSITLTIILSPWMGAAGPLIGSLIALISCIYLPGLRMVLRLLRAERT